MAGVRKWQAELEVLRPVGALHAECRIELVAEIFGRHVEGAVGIDLLDISGKIVEIDRGGNADAGQVLLQIFGDPLEALIVGIVGQPQVEADTICAALVARLIKQLLGAPSDR